jgi:hypothetical protein
LEVGRKTDDLALQKKLLLRNPKSENRMTNLAESSKEGYASGRAVLPVMMTAEWNGTINGEFGRTWNEVVVV